MADKMLRVAGRSTSGMAKAISVSDEGVLLTKSPDVNFKVIVSNQELVASGGEVTTRSLAPLSSELVGFNVSATATTSFDFNLQWRLGGVTAGTGLIETETVKLVSNKPHFIPVGVLKSAHLVLNLKNTGTQNALFTVQEVYGIKHTPVGKDKDSGLHVYGQSFEKDKSGAPTLRVSEIKKLQRVNDAVLFGSVAAKTLTDTNEVISDSLSLIDRDELDIFVLNATLVPVEIKITATFGSDDMLVSFYDHNTDTWAVNANNQQFPGITIPHARGLVRTLSTHPDMYWLRELKAASIKIGVRATATPNGYIQIWVGGRKYVQ